MERPPPERGELEIRFLPIACSAPLLYAHSHGFFEQNGLRVKLQPAPSWGGIHALMVYGELSVAHLLSPFPLAAHLGLCGKHADLRLVAIQNVNGQSIVISQRHAGLSDVRGMKGFTLGVPHRFSMQNYILRDLVAKNGLDPDADITIKEVAPPRVPQYLADGRIDGALSPEPFGQIAVQRGAAFIHALSRDIWQGHPCCCLAMTQRFLDECPRTAEAVLRSLLSAQRALHSADTAERRSIARELMRLGYWNDEDSPAMEQVFTGTFSDGRGATHSVPDRIDFIPDLWSAYGVWILSQMQRWGDLPGEVDYRGVTDAVFTTASTSALSRSVGFASGAPSVAGVAPCSAEDAFAIMRSQPFCAFSPRAPARARHDLPDAARGRLSEIIEQIAGFIGGREDFAVERTAEGELGWLEQIIGDMLSNARFAREAIAERVLLERSAERQRGMIAAQEELIRDLSAPIVPVLAGVVALPLVGRIDDARAQRITEAVLTAVNQRRAEVVLVDITGVSSIDAAVMGNLLKMMQAASLLGAECALVGVSPGVATTLVALGVDLSGVRALRDLQDGVEYARVRVQGRS